MTTVNVSREYDGLHRLSLAVAEWSKAVANQGGRGEQHAEPVAFGDKLMTVEQAYAVLSPYLCNLKEGMPGDVKIAVTTLQHALTDSADEPACWVILDADEDQPMEARFRGAESSKHNCNDHINDCLNNGLEDYADSIVRPAYLRPPAPHALDGFAKMANDFMVELAAEMQHLTGSHPDDDPSELRGEVLHYLRKLQPAPCEGAGKQPDANDEAARLITAFRNLWETDHNGMLEHCVATIDSIEKTCREADAWLANHNQEGRDDD